MSGLANQLGNVSYTCPRKFREKLGQWLDLIRTMWPECPARVCSDGTALLVAPAAATLPGELRMPAHDRSFVTQCRVPLEVIDAAVSARFGPARVAGNAQPAAF